MSVDVAVASAAPCAADANGSGADGDGDTYWVKMQSMIKHFTVSRDRVGHSDCFPEMLALADDPSSTKEGLSPPPATIRVLERHDYGDVKVDASPPPKDARDSFVCTWGEGGAFWSWQTSRACWMYGVPVIAYGHVAYTHPRAIELYRKNQRAHVATVLEAAQGFVGTLVKETTSPSPSAATRTFRVIAVEGPFITLNRPFDTTGRQRLKVQFKSKRGKKGRISLYSKHSKNDIWYPKRFASTTDPVGDVCISGKNFTGKPTWFYAT